MDSRRNKVLAVLCLASLVLVWRVYAVWNRYLPAPAQGNPIPAGTGLGVASPGSEKGSVRPDGPTIWESQKVVAAQPWGRDPFADVSDSMRPKEAEQAEDKKAEGVPPPASVRFTGVSASDNNWLAVVRGDIVRVGDVIDGKYAVIAINKRSLTLAADGWTFRYELGSEEPFVRPASETP
jgi:hypothetical protein